VTRQGDDLFGPRPGESPLRTARRRVGWTQAAAMCRFATAVADLNEMAPSGASLKRMFAYWENGERAVSVETYQRAFVAIYQQSPECLGFVSASSLPVGAATASLPVNSAEGVETLRRGLDHLLADGAPSTTVLDDWEELATRYGRATRDRPAGLMLADLADELVQLQAALVACRTTSGKRHLTRVVAQMSGLMLLTLVKLDERSAFRRWARTARIAADEAGDPTTQAWVLAQEAYGQYYSEDLSEAVAVAQRAQVVAGGTRSVGAPLVSALEARTYASLGQRRETIAALGRAEDLVSMLADALQPSAFGYNEAQLRFHAGSAYAQLHDSAGAFAAQDRALELCSLGDYTDRAMTRLDRACCFAYEGDAALAAGEIAESLIGPGDDQRRGIIDLRAVDVVDGMSERDRALPVVRDRQDLIAPAHLREDRHP
jgi:tetratricopeptide (TPR) repeat protein